MLFYKPYTPIPYTQRGKKNRRNRKWFNVTATTMAILT